jgi:L-ascorbate metabolism protein UlaG (beta-lactamase superfamily)
VQITVERHGHSCVVVRTDSGTLVIDPGVWSNVPAALAGAAAVLVTHEHIDHVDVPAVAASGLPVYGPAPVMDLLREAGAAHLHEVADGQTLTVAGVPVQVLGEWHEPIHRDAPQFANVGYLIDRTVLHPGDAYLDVPGGVEVALAFAPVSGPWLRISDVVDWIRRVRPARVVPVHDGTVLPTAVALAVQWIERLCDVEVVQPAQGVPLA